MIMMIMVMRVVIIMIMIRFMKIMHMMVMFLVTLYMPNPGFVHQVPLLTADQTRLGLGATAG